MRACVVSGTREVELQWPKAQKNRGTVRRRYLNIDSPLKLPKSDVQLESRKRWIAKRAEVVNQVVEDLTLGSFGEVMTKLAESRGYLLLKKNELVLTVSDCIALRDWTGVANNGLHRMKQAIESLRPVLRGLLLPSCIRNKVRIEERRGVILPRVVEVSCTLTRKGNLEGMRSFIYVEYPGQLIANMIKSAILNGELMDSNSFSALDDKIVILIGIGKAASDLIQYARVVNRRKGNNRL